MSLVIEDRTCFSGFCPCLYYNAVLGHVKQDWLCQPCLAMHSAYNLSNLSSKKISS